MFAPGQLRGVEPIPIPKGFSELESQFWGRVLEVESLPLGAFRVLSGMLVWHGQMCAPLQRYSACADPGDRDLLRLSAPFPNPAPKCSFAVTIHPPQRTAAALKIDVEFQRPPPAPDRHQLIEAFKWWDELVQGGYPVPVESAGSSGVGASSTRFLSPVLLRHDLEAWEADKACFAPILNLAQRWSIQYGVRAVEIA